MVRTPNRRLGGRRRAAPLLLAAAALCAGVAGAADNSGKPAVGIYTCVDNLGRRLTADRPIPECSTKEQQVLNRDGSLKTIHPPTLTAEERAEKESRERRASEARAAVSEAVRRDRNLMKRYPNEAAHQRAREGALDTVRLAMKATDTRLRELSKERRPLLSEAEFYQGRTMPPKLNQQIEANDASSDAQREASANQEAELGRINRLYDAELNRLRQLWAGAAAGSMGPMPQTQTVINPAAIQPVPGKATQN